MDQGDVSTLLQRLTSDEDAVRKLAVFKLQSSINDPSFADVFISSGGLVILRSMIMNTSGNTLAYSLQCLTRLLEVDMGWQIFEAASAGELVERIVELIITHPLVNILRGAMGILVAIVAHPQTKEPKDKMAPSSFGFRALKPAVAVYPTFFEMVVNQLGTADHALCTNSLMLLNALVRDAVTGGEIGRDGIARTSGTGEEWPKFIKRLQDLGLIKAAYTLMQSSSLQDLAHPLLEFQSLTKMLLQKWRDMKVDLDKSEHRRALKALHLASAPPDRSALARQEVNSEHGAAMAEGGPKNGKKHNPEKWRRLGFETENPAWEFEPTGFLGMMDLTDYIRKHEDAFQKLLLEQSSQPLHERCPFTRSSLAVTAILYEHFDVSESETTARSYMGLDGVKDYDKLFKPLLLQWSRLHVAALAAFFRLWKCTGAVQDDFDKVAELVRILIEQVVGSATRIRDVREIEEELAEFEYGRLRNLQMELLELTFEDQWGSHLQLMRENLRAEAVHFIKEQRIRCLLSGSWFPRPHSSANPDLDLATAAAAPNDRPQWRYAKLSHNRRYLHFADYATQSEHEHEPTLDQLHRKIDLNTISSVVSNVSGPSEDRSPHSSSSTLKELSQTRAAAAAAAAASPTTKITINSFEPVSHADTASIPPPSRNGNNKLSLERPAAAAQHSQQTTTTTTGGEAVEHAILTLAPATHTLASEWLDGLLMLLNQAPITAETNRLIELVADYGLRIRLLGVRTEDMYGGEQEEGRGVVPSREGLDEDYYYEV